MTRAQRIIEVATRIVELRAQLLDAERELVRLVPDGEKPLTVSAGAMTAVGHDALVSGPGAATKIPARIMEILRSAPAKVFEPKDVIRALGEGTNVKSVRQALSRLAAKKQIRAVGRGQYQAAG